MLVSASLRLALALSFPLCVGCAATPLVELEDTRRIEGEVVDGEAHLTLEARLPTLGSRVRDPVLELPPIVETWVARIDGEEIARHERPGGSPAAPGLRTVLVPLRPSQLGRTLTLEIASRHLRIGPMAPPHVGERGDVISAIVARDVGPLGVACLLALAGGLVWLSVLGAKSDRRARVTLGATLLSFAAYVIHYTQVRDLIVDAPRIFTLAWGAAIPIAALGVVALTRMLVVVPAQSRAGRALLLTERALTWTAAVYLTLAVGVQLALPFAPMSWGRAYYALLIPLDLWVRAGVALAVCVVVPVVASRARQDRSALFVLLGVGALGAASAMDVFLFLASAKARWTSDVAWGALGLGAALVASFWARFAAMRMQVEASAAALARKSKEREAMVHDLHDGLGSLVTNIRMLAGVSERAVDKPQYAAIGELAEEAIGELRAFTRATREGEASWEVIAAEVRQSSARLVAPHGRAVELTSRVNAGAPAASALIAHHVSRVAREAVMNAIKHTHEGAIALRLDVSAESMVLEIEDEGAGAASESELEDRPDWLSSGIGMKSMRARAEALGGSLEVRQERGTVIRLEVRWAP